MGTNKTITDFAGRSVNSQSQHWCTPPKYVDAVKRVIAVYINSHMSRGPKLEDAAQIFRIIQTLFS